MVDNRKIYLKQILDGGDHAHWAVPREISPAYYVDVVARDRDYGYRVFLPGPNEDSYRGSEEVHCDSLEQAYETLLGYNPHGHPISSRVFGYDPRPTVTEEDLAIHGTPRISRGGCRDHGTQLYRTHDAAMVALVDGLCEKAGLDRRRAGLVAEIVLGPGILEEEVLAHKHLAEEVGPRCRWNDRAGFAQNKIQRFYSGCRADRYDLEEKLWPEGYGISLLQVYNLWVEAGRAALQATFFLYGVDGLRQALAFEDAHASLEAMARNPTPALGPLPPGAHYLREPYDPARRKAIVEFLDGEPGSGRSTADPDDDRTREHQKPGGKVEASDARTRSSDPTTPDSPGRQQLGLCPTFRHIDRLTAADGRAYDLRSDGQVFLGTVPCGSLDQAEALPQEVREAFDLSLARHRRDHRNLLAASEVTDHFGAWWAGLAPWPPVSDCPDFGPVDAEPLNREEFVRRLKEI